MSMPVCFLIHSLSNIAVLYICVICGFLEGLMEDWFHQMSNPRKIKNLLTYLHTYLLILSNSNSTGLHSKVSTWHHANMSV